MARAPDRHVVVPLLDRNGLRGHGSIGDSERTIAYDGIWGHRCDGLALPAADYTMSQGSIVLFQPGGEPCSDVSVLWQHC
jgi:hypothetical protein